MGERFVQKGSSHLAEATIQRQSRFIPPLEIGTSVIAVYKQEEPCEVRVSRTVLWERGGGIPLRDPIVKRNRVTRNKKYEDTLNTLF